MTGGKITLEEKILTLQTQGLYEIMFRNAGVGCQFYEGPDYYAEGAPERPDDWRKHLTIYRYYPTLSESVNAELERLGLMELV